MRKYSCISRGKGAIYFPDAGKEFADKDLVKITVDTWQHES